METDPSLSPLRKVSSLARAIALLHFRQTDKPTIVAFVDIYEIKLRPQEWGKPILEEMGKWMKEQVTLTFLKHCKLK